jgi:hypothetical protein
MEDDKESLRLPLCRLATYLAGHQRIEGVNDDRKDNPTRFIHDTHQDQAGTSCILVVCNF